jgi:hypothetical protein
MAVEEIVLNGRTFVTLKELLRPGLKAIFVGLNPAEISVTRGHYYQGIHGLRFWDQLSRYRILPPFPRGTEDDAAFELGFGFTDLVRLPTKSSRDINREAKSAAVLDLGVRLSKIGDRPLIVFRYKEPWILAGPHLTQMNYRVVRMPSPYTKREIADAMMKEFQIALGIM